MHHLIMTWALHLQRDPGLPGYSRFCPNDGSTSDLENVPFTSVDHSLSVDPKSRTREQIKTPRKRIWYVCPSMSNGGSDDLTSDSGKIDIFWVYLRIVSFAGVKDLTTKTKTNKIDILRRKCVFEGIFGLKLCLFFRLWKTNFHSPPLGNSGGHDDP